MYRQGANTTHHNRTDHWSAALVRTLALTASVAALLILTVSPAFAATSDPFEPDSRLNMPALTAGASPVVRAIGSEGDIDWFSLDVQAGHTYVLDVTPDERDPWVDLTLDVYASGTTTVLGSDDDGGTNLMPRLTLTALASGTWHIRLAGHSEWTTGAYSIAARDISGATLAGTATGLGDIPIGYALVTVYAPDSLGWSKVASAYSDSAGSYSFTLEAGTYRLGAEQSSGQGTYYPSTRTIDAASDIELAEGENCVLPPVSAVRWTRLNGTVTNWDGSQPAAGISIAAYTYINGAWKASSWTTADINGSWRMAIAENTYKFGFSDPSGALLPRFNNDADTLEAAPTITVTAENPALVTHLNFAGQVSDPQPSGPSGPPSVHAIAGENRYGTAVEISREAFPNGADAVIVVTGTSWPDGLGAASLAGALDAPILLVKPDSVPPIVAAEIKRLGATHAVIVGGASAVDPTVEQDLQYLVGAGAIQRFGGRDRYATARLVAEETMRVLDAAGTPWDGTYILASGLSFPDVLAASPLSAAKGWPVLLTKRDALPGATRTFLADHPDATALIVGGPAVVSDLTANATSLSGETPTRVYGTDRYQTALRIAEYASRGGLLDYSRLAIATGQDFPDALTCSALQAENGSVLLLTPGSKVNAGVASTLGALPAEQCERITFVGGESAISSSVRGELASQIAE